jgi:hypothetical protein
MVSVPENRVLRRVFRPKRDVAHMGKMRKSYRILVGNLREETTCET